jgi:hypothetical protein
MSELPPSKDQLRITGICRDADCATSLALFFNRVPTDDEMRAVHESLRPTPEPPAKQCSKGGECGYLDGKGSCIYCGEPHPDQPSALRDALDAIASPSRPEDYGWWTQVARRALGVATANETAAPPPDSARNELAWLIEMSFDGKAHWWYGSDFIADAAQAVRFSRKQDADQVILERGLVDAVATEHMWCSGPTKEV